MRLVLLGPPGSGKGTQAKLLNRRLNLEHLSTGDLLRAAIRAGTPVGVRARPYVESGNLVPDAVVNDLVAERFNREDRPERFVLDGYPRTVAQAEALDGVLRRNFLDLTAAVLVTLDDEEIVRRISGRWSCPKPGCQATYHAENKPPRAAGVCDVCGTALVQRADDRPETVRTRLAVYHRETAEVGTYYRAQGLLQEVCGAGAVEEVYAAIVKAVTPQGGMPC
jgi:adenylate kinase